MEKRNLLIDLEELSALQMDSVNGFKQIKEKIEDNRLKEFIVLCHEQSTLLWNEINEEIINLQGEIKTKGTIKGAINHLWMKLKTDLVNSDLKNILENIKVCEEFNITRYKSVLSSRLPQHIKIKLQKHLQILSLRLNDLVLLQQNLGEQKADQIL
ncbi:MAG: NAD-dependent aldehyde dehydrogenase [Bacteroidetes bacterium]|jgi:uncharacterized protein (TIGR02284 family)|nr:NAD-dependent aldehyde dehydrogenase [Bacteroidota bacterium]